MSTWRHDVIERLGVAEAPAALLHRLVAAARELGFEHCAVGVRLPYPLSRSRVEIFSNYPVAWQQHYVRSGYLEVDPSVAHGRRSREPALWSDALFAPAPALWEDARAAGLRHGWFASTVETCGTASMLTLARGAESIDERELQGRGERMAWLAHAAHLTFTRALTPTHLRDAQTRLTGREIEVLRWTADGKSSAEIADILAISDNTVNFHIKNAMKKLHASNKTAATVRAAMLGLLAS